MASVKDEVSEVDEGDELPSDFFDEFSKEDFMAGLSVLDECSVSDNEEISELRERISESAVNGVKDLRELIGNNPEDNDARRKTKNWSQGRQNLSSEQTDLNSYIKPGSRRDPSKTNQAIKKDKEVKVQRFLAKTLESADELRPPGTELDEYYEEYKKDSPNIGKARRKYSKDFLPHLQLRRSPPPSPHRRYSPQSNQSSRAWYSPRQSSSRGHFYPHGRYSPRSRFSPPMRQDSPYMHYSPTRTTSRNFTQSSHSNYRRHGSPHRRSPVRSVYRRSPERQSPRRHIPHSRSPQRRAPRRTRTRSRTDSRSRSRLRSPSRSRHETNHHNDRFLYPNDDDHRPEYSSENRIYQSEADSHHYGPKMHPKFGGGGPVNSRFYPQTQAYGSSFSDSYNYPIAQGTQVSVYGPGGMSKVTQVSSQPTLMPNVPPPPAMVSAPPAMVSAPPAMVPAPPAMVPAPPAMVSAPTNTTTSNKTTPYDALAQLVAEGKISQEDYLKLTPHKGISTVDIKTKVKVLSRCSQALTRLREKLLVPNRLIIHDKMIGSEDKQLAHKYCSPLKRQLAAEFSFMKRSISPTRQRKQLVESIVSTLGLDKVVSKYKNKLNDVKHAAVQTTKPQCDICEIREATKYHDVGTSTDPEYMTSTVHTQVLEQDLISSKSIFNPTGSIGEGADISIAHLTPAQLVSKLAARAKTLSKPQEPPPSNQYPRRPPSSYGYDNRGSQYHHSFNNYRY